MGVVRPVGPHTLGHCFATDLLAAGYCVSVDCGRSMRCVRGSIMNSKPVPTWYMFSLSARRSGTCSASPER